MGLETPTYIADLNIAWPLGTDVKSAGDDHIRAIKSVLQNTFPGLAGAFARVQAKATGYTPVANDNTSLFDCSASLTLSLTAAATLGNKWTIAVYARGGAVTIDPNGAEQINGAATLTVPQGTFAIVWCNGTAFYAMLSQPYDATLAALAALATGADKLAYSTGADTFAETAFTAFARTILDDTDAGTVRTTIGAAADASTQSIWVPAGALTPRATNGPASGNIALGNGIQQKTLDYDASTAEYAQVMIRMPKGWNENTYTAYFVWTAANTGNVVWATRAVAVGDDDVMNASFGTAQSVTDGVTAADDMMQSAATSAVTIAGTPAENDLVVFEVYRDAANGSDTCTVDAKLIGVLINYVTTSLNDA